MYPDLWEFFAKLFGVVALIVVIGLVLVAGCVGYQLGR